MSHRWMRSIRFLLLLSALFTAATAYAQGPPFQTDDPVPVDYQHFEFYVFGAMDGTPVEVDSTAPAIEFNWGAVPRVQLHAVLPLGSINPMNHPAYAPAGQGPSAFGLIDSEVGAKIAWIKESKYVPQIGTFTMFELPTGDFDRGLGLGTVWYKLPLWLQKNFGNLLLDGGAGETVVPQSGFRNYPYGGFLGKYKFNDRLELGAELFAHGAEGPAAPQSGSSTMFDMGGYYHFKNHPGRQFLFCYGHSVAGQTENYAYLGMYWTWGKKGADASGDDASDGEFNVSPFRSTRF